MLKVVEVPPHLICVEDTIVKSERKRINRQSDPKGHYDKETDHPNSNFRLSMVPKKDMASESLRNTICSEMCISMNKGKVMFWLKKKRGKIKSNQA